VLLFPQCNICCSRPYLLLPLLFLPPPLHSFTMVCQDAPPFCCSSRTFLNPAQQPSPRSFPPPSCKPGDFARRFRTCPALTLQRPWQAAIFFNPSDRLYAAAVLSFFPPRGFSRYLSGPPFKHATAPQRKGYLRDIFDLIFLIPTCLSPCD